MHRPKPNGPFEQPREFTFTDAHMAQVQKHIAKYPEGKQQSAVMPLLSMAQQQDGWVSIAAMEEIARLLGMPYIRVHEVASFYSQYMLNPIGTHHVQCCTTTPCWLRGSDEVVKACREYLGVEVGHTSEDGLFTLSEVECLGACVNAPMMQVNGHVDGKWYDVYFEDLDYDNTLSVLRALKSGRVPESGSQTGRKSSEPTTGPTTLENQRAIWKKEREAV